LTPQLSSIHPKLPNRTDAAVYCRKLNFCLRGRTQISAVKTYLKSITEALIFLFGEYKMGCVQVNGKGNNAYVLLLQGAHQTFMAQPARFFPPVRAVLCLAFYGLCLNPRSD